MKKSLSTNAVSVSFLSILLVACTVTTTVALRGPLIRLNENQILYLFSTSAQVLAAIYGLTLTGFLFFRNELSREESDDNTLSEAIASLRSRYFQLLIFITVLVGIALVLSNLAIAHEAFGESTVNSIILNCGQSAYGVSLLAIAYFIFDVVSPDRIERASRTLQDTVDPKVSGEMRGDLEEFLRNYNQIETSLKDVFGLFLQESDQAGAPRHWSNARMAEMLYRTERISKDLFLRLQQLITLRNSIIHGADPVVSKAIVCESGDLRNELSKVVNRKMKGPEES